LGVFNANYSDPAVSRIANQFLFAPAVDSGKAEIRRIDWHGCRALKPPPLWRLP
jgi:hypothetical protein